MSLRHRLLKFPLVSPFGRRLSGPLDRGWGDTVITPVEGAGEGDAQGPDASPATRDATRPGIPEGGKRS